MIRWINERLGTAPATSAEIDDELARVDVRDLVDKFGNDPQAVRAKIDQGVALLEQGRRVIICCDYGISRSNAVAAGILSQFEGVPLHQAIRTVAVATGEKEIKLEPLNAVRMALGGGGTTGGSGKPRVMITGGTGFIGRYLIDALAADAEIVITAGSELDLTSGALALELLVHEHGLDQIVHLANPRVYTSNRATGDTVSILRNVLDVCRSTGARLVYLSGWEVYSGYETPELHADETMPLRPKGPYGEAKMLCELLIEHHRKLHALDASIIRSSPVYGVGSDRPKFIYNFARKARENAVIRTHRYSNADPALELMHVGDLARLLAAVVTTRAQGDFNVGGGQLYSTTAIADMIVAHFKSASVVEQQPVGDGIGNIVMDSRRAQDILGWQPQRGLAETLADLMAQLGDK